MNRSHRNITAICVGRNLIVLGCVLGLATACSSSEESGPAAEPSSSKKKIVFKNGAGARAYVVEFMPDGKKIVDGSGVDIARIQGKGRKLTVKGPDDAVLGHVRGGSNKLVVKSPDKSRDLFVMKRSDDGDYKLETGAGALLYRVKERKYGFEVYDMRSGERVDAYKVKVKGDKTRVRGPSGEVRYSTKTRMPAAALVPLGFEVLPPGFRWALFDRLRKKAKAL